MIAVLAVGTVSVPTAWAQAKGAAPPYFAIKGAKIVTVSGGVIENGTVVVANGLVAAVGVDAKIPPEAWVIDGKGMTVYPGLIDAMTDVGLPAAGELAAAGVKIAFATFDIEFVRRLPSEAGQAVGYGLSQDDALKAVTINPAQMFGLDKELGTIEQGKIANIIVTTGDPLELQTDVRYLFIKGQLTSTDNKHRQLYEKYRVRP